MICLGDFEGPNVGFNFTLGQEFPGAKGSLTRDTATAHGGKASARLQADFTAGGVYVAMTKALADTIELREVRFWIKSTEAGELRVRLIDGSGQVHQQFVSFKPDGAWQQAVVSNFTAGRGYMSWGGANDKQWHQPLKGLDLILEKGNLAGKLKGTVWIDDVEVVGKRVEVLAVKADQTQLGNVYLTGQPVRFHLASGAARVGWRVVDFWGKACGEGTAAVKDGGCELTLPGLKPGYFTLDLKAEKPGAIAAERSISFAILTPLDRATPAGSSPLGVMTHFAQNWDTDIMPLVALSGAGWVRDEIYWNHVEKSKGQFVFDPQYERYMKGLREQGVAPLVPLTFANANYDGGNTPYTDTGFDGYARYAQEVLKHYGRQIQAVEIWNEYNGSFCAGPAKQDRPATYVQMLRRAYEKIKADRPDVTVVGCSTVGTTLPFFDRVFRAGGLKWMDAVSVHPYRYGDAPEGIETEMARLDRLIRQYNQGQPKPIWVTEVGWYVKPADEPGDMPVTEADQAKFVVRGYVLLYSAGVEKVFWYLFRDYNEFATMGLVRGGGDPRGHYAPKPAYVAFANMARQLAGAKCAGREATLHNVYSVRFQAPTGDVRVLWSLEPAVLSLKTKQALVVTDMMGEARTVEPSGGEVRLGLSDAPQFVKGSIDALPPPDRPAAEVDSAGTIVADSALDFSATQGKGNWRYGYCEFGGSGPINYAAGSFREFPEYRVTEWREEWSGKVPYLSVTRDTQHPGAVGQRPIWSVRRWVSSVDGRVRISGQLRRGPKGDGSIVRIFVEGKEIMTRQLGGGQSLKAKFDLETPVHAGDRVDFAVDPGPAADTSFDETWIGVTIEDLAKTRSGRGP